MPRTPIDYAKTLIYKLVCNDLTVQEIYVGHTTDLTNRKRNHKNSVTNEKQPNYNCKKSRTIRENGGWDNWSMIVIETYPCNNKNEARARERYWYETLNAKMNTLVPGRTREEYEQTNERKQYKKEYNKEYNKEYQQTDEYKAYQKAYYQRKKLEKQQKANEITV